MKQFLMTFNGQHSDWNKKTQADWDELGQKHKKWMANIGDSCKAAAKLASKPSKLLSEAGGSARITDGPFSETKEMLTGFYLISAENIDHAAELGKDCPWLLHDKMEIFEVEE